MHQIIIDKEKWEIQFLRDDSDSIKEIREYASDALERINGNEHLRREKRIIEDISRIIGRSDLPYKNKKEESELSGCASIRYTKKSELYFAMVQVTERKHNEQIIVRGDVFKRNGIIREENSILDVRYFKRNRFDGLYSKRESAIYAKKLIDRIAGLFFSEDDNIITFLDKGFNKLNKLFRHSNRYDQKAA